MLGEAFASEAGPKTRRHLAAAVGELLFYIASQVCSVKACLQPLHMLLPGMSALCKSFNNLAWARTLLPIFLEEVQLYT